jgi:hypothetical protein
MTLVKFVEIANVVAKNALPAGRGSFAVTERAVAMGTFIKMLLLSHRSTTKFVGAKSETKLQCQFFSRYTCQCLLLQIKGSLVSE